LRTKPAVSAIKFTLDNEMLDKQKQKERESNISVQNKKMIK